MTFFSRNPSRRNTRHRCWVLIQRPLYFSISACSWRNVRSLLSPSNRANSVSLTWLLGPRPMPPPRYLPAALARRRNLPRPGTTDAETPSQLRQTPLATVVRLQQLLPQIIRICSRHLLLIWSRKIAKPTLHYREKCSRRDKPPKIDLAFPDCVHHCHLLLCLPLR